MTIDPCPYCMAETMIRKAFALGGDVEECLDCGYVREVKRKKSGKEVA